MLKLDGTGPLYHQIYRAFRQNILSRSLLPGEPVPSTRALSDLLKISRNTAVLAYELLLAEGYLEAGLGAAGTIVASVLPPDSRHFISPRSDPNRNTSNPTSVRLALAGERILSSAQQVRNSLGLPILSWELTPPHISTVTCVVAMPQMPHVGTHWSPPCRRSLARGPKSVVRTRDFTFWGG